MKRLWGISLILLSLLLPFTTKASTLQTAVEMESLTQVKASEKDGNQLYINIFESCSTKTKKVCDNALPPPPLHWQFLKGSSPKKTWLWQGKLDEGDVVKIVFIVHEKGFRPLNSNETIGTMTLNLKNEQGTLQTNWTSGQGTTSYPIDHFTTKFHLEANGGIYGIYETIFKIKLD